MSTTPTQREREATARLGLTLCAKWRLDKLLGVGGMAAVYEATHRNGKRGAVKILHEDVRDGATRRRFLREGQIANHVRHEGIVSVLDDDVAEDGSPFLVMDLLEGEALHERAARTGNKLDCDVVLALAAQVLDALAAAHDKGIVHRDIKPENLFVTTDARVKVLDFGIAHLEEPTEARARETQVGAAMGTPAFMAPEQARGRWDLVGPGSDLWAVGATMFTLLTGELVHDEPSLAELLAATVTKPVRSLATALPGAPKPLVAVVDRALEMTISDRWRDAREMGAAVRIAYRAIVGEDLPATAGGASPDETGPRMLIARRPRPLASTPLATIASTTRQLAIDAARRRPRAALMFGALAVALGAAAFATLKTSGSVPVAAAQSLDVGPPALHVIDPSVPRRVDDPLAVVPAQNDPARPSAASALDPIGVKATVIASSHAAAVGPGPRSRERYPKSLLDRRW